MGFDGISDACVKTLIRALDGLRYRRLFTVTDVEYVPSDYKKGNEPPAEGWMPYDVATVPLKGVDAHYWLRASFRTPAVAPHEQLVLRVTTGKEGAWDATNPQGILYLNGEMVQGLDTNHCEAFLAPETDYALANYFYVGMIDHSVKCEMRVYALDSDVERLYYDLKVPYDTCQLLDPNSDERIRMTSVLVEASRIVDLRDPQSEAFRASLAEALCFMDGEFYGRLCTTAGKPTVHCIGHTHIDVEWQWTRHQTREKIQRSFATAKALMDRYPEYKFMLSQPELYRYLKEEAPEKYAELKALVKEGRWEPEGAMYLEADCNLISGESLVRQILVGKKFFRDEFGVDCRILFLPDVFGYNAAMPQVLKKCGIDYFVTSKISWNDRNTLPVDAFMWEGLDGSEIFTSFITTQDHSTPPKNRTTYVGKINPSHVKGTWTRFQQKEYTDRALLTFGYGDGGGGPTKEMLEVQRRLAKGLPGMPVTEIRFLRDYLDLLKESFDRTAARTSRTPRWVGELYLEFHRGTYTSIAKVKKGNRDSEWLLSDVEALSVTDNHLLGGAYDAEGLARCWRKVLHDQFHDIIPGSSIEAVYDLTDVDYREIAAYGNAVVAEKLDRLSASIASTGGTLVYNPTGFARKGAVTVDGVCRELTKEIPAYGWSVVDEDFAETAVRVDGSTLENRFYVLRLAEDGSIASLYDKRAERKVFRDGLCGNVLKAFDDHPVKYDAWDIDEFYKLKCYAVDGAERIEPVLDGSRAGFRISSRYMHSTIVQTVWLYSELTRIDFETEIDWHEEHQLLKAVFPLDVHCTSATYDIQFGHVSRPTHGNTSWDEAKFETCAHKWVDLSEHGYGVSLLNDCKYGHSTEGSDLSLTLLKCATFPNPHADQGKHTFTYSLMPHVGDFREAGVIGEAHALNRPLKARAIAAHGGALASEFSMVSCDAPNVVVTAVKQAEADDGLIVRLHEAFDTRTGKVSVKVADGYTKAYLCDLLENPTEELALVDNAVSFPLGNFEIVTLKLV